MKLRLFPNFFSVTLTSLNLFQSNMNVINLRSMSPRYTGQMDKQQQKQKQQLAADSSMEKAETAAWDPFGVGGVGFTGARPKRPSLPGNLGSLEPEDERLLEVSEDLETQSEAVSVGYFSSMYTNR